MAVQIQVSKITAKALRDLAAGSESVVVMDGDEPLVRIVPASVEVKAKADYFVHYPHDPSDCFGTCWRHAPKTDAVPETVAA